MDNSEISNCQKIVEYKLVKEKKASSFDQNKPSEDDVEEEELFEKDDNNVVFGQEIKKENSDVVAEDKSEQQVELNDDLDTENKNVYLTAPIYYVNGDPHIGHLYTSFAVDILARFEKLLCKQVFTSFGTDEHGQKIQTAAGKQSPQEYVDQTHLQFKKLLKSAHIEANSFIRTTDDLHKKTATHFWELLVNSGLTYEGNYSGWYSERDESYYKEDEIEDGKSKETGSPVEFLSEECTFFKLSAMKESLLQYYRENLDVIKPKFGQSEVMNMIKGDLPDLAISRSRFSWGIKVPGSKDKVMYVWVDALCNYLSSIGYPRNKDYADWWSGATHIIGKDILKFHAIYWPAMLIAVGLEPPKRIFSHGWWTIDGEKMSKSIGNVVDPFHLIDRYDADCLRYYMFRESTFGNDCNFSVDSLVQTINSELSNELGNLVQRVLAFCSKKFGSTIASPITTVFSRDHNCKNMNWSYNSWIEMISNLDYVYSKPNSDIQIKTNQVQDQFNKNDESLAKIDHVDQDKKQNNSSSTSNALIVRPNLSFKDRVKGYWKGIYAFFAGEDVEEVAFSQEKEQTAKKSIDINLSIEILREWDSALIESIYFIKEQQVSGYVNKLREAIIKTNKYVDLQSPWKHEDPSEVLGVLCLCIQRLALLSQPIIPEKSREILCMLGISGSLKNWFNNNVFPIYNPKPVFEKVS